MKDLYEVLIFVLYSEADFVSLVYPISKSDLDFAYLVSFGLDLGFGGSLIDSL